MPLYSSSLSGDVAITGNLTVTGSALGVDLPGIHGIASWCYSPALAVNSTQVTGGTVYLTRIDIAADVTVSTLYWWVGNVGASPSAGQNEVGLYDSGGSLLAAANVDSDISSSSLKETSIASQALSAGTFYWVGMVFNASATPTLTRGSGWTGVGGATTIGQDPAEYAFATAGTGQTALPSSITPASNAAASFAGPWAAVG